VNLEYLYKRYLCAVTNVITKSLINIVIGGVTAFVNIRPAYAAEENDLTPKPIEVNVR